MLVFIKRMARVHQVRVNADKLRTGFGKLCFQTLYALRQSRYLLLFSYAAIGIHPL